MDISLLIQHINKKIKLSEKDISFITEQLNAETFKKGDFLLEQGDLCKHSSYVLKGCLKMYHTDKDGDEHIVSFAIEDWWAGDLASFISGSPADYSVKCLENSTVVHFSHETYGLLYAKVPLFEKFFRELISNAYVHSQKRIIHNFSLTAKERYVKFRKKYPQFEQRVPQYLIASYLGITKEFLSKTRKEITFEKKSLQN